MLASPNRWLMLGIAYVVLLATYVPYVGWTPKLTEIVEDLSLSYTEAGALSSIAGLTAGIALLVGGGAITKWGAKNVLLLGLATGAVGTFVFAFAEGYGVALAGRVISGASVGFLFVGSYTLAVNWFEQRGETGRALGIMATGDGIGILFTLYVFAMVLTALGWRQGLVAGAIGLVVLFILTVILVRDVPSATDSEGAAHGKAPNWREVLRVLGQRNILLASLFNIGSIGLGALTASWMPTVLMESAGWSEAGAGIASSGLALAGIVTGPLGGVLSDRVGRKPVLVISGLAATAAVALLTGALAAQNYALVAIAIFLVGLALYAAYPVFLAVSIDSVEPALAGAVNGAVIGAGWIIGGFLYPYFLGSIKDSTGDYVVGFVAITIATFVFCALTPLFAKQAAQHATEISASSPTG